jgi:hypothetical protein
MENENGEDTNDEGSEARDGINRYARAARALARSDKIGAKTLADREFMSKTTAERCLRGPLRAGSFLRECAGRAWLLRLRSLQLCWTGLRALSIIWSPRGAFLGAPVAFFVVVSLAALALWAALSWKFDAQISSRDAIIAAKESVIEAQDATIKFQGGLIAEYKNKLQIPTEAGEDWRLAPEQKTIPTKELKSKIDTFSKIIIYTVSEREPKQYTEAIYRYNARDWY